MNSFSKVVSPGLFWLENSLSCYQYLGGISHARLPSASKVEVWSPHSRQHNLSRPGATKWLIPTKSCVVRSSKQGWSFATCRRHSCAIRWSWEALAELSKCYSHCYRLSCFFFFISTVIPIVLQWYCDILVTFWPFQISTKHASSDGFAMSNTTCRAMFHCGTVSILVSSCIPQFLYGILYLLLFIQYSHIFPSCIPCWCLLIAPFFAGRRPLMSPVINAFKVILEATSLDCQQCAVMITVYHGTPRFHTSSSLGSCVSHRCYERCISRWQKSSRRFRKFWAYTNHPTKFRHACQLLTDNMVLLAR